MKVIAANKKAEYDYLISKKIEAGIVLLGSEVKSLRVNTGSIRGSYILEKDGNLWLSNCYIKKYNKILGLIKQGGFTVVPLSLLFNDKGLAKLIFGIGKGKKKYDKRQTLKEKDWNIKKERYLKKN